ncbi:MAG: outer membrane protein assembly factor [Acidobacteriota bacterium]
MAIGARSAIKSVLLFWLGAALAAAAMAQAVSPDATPIIVDVRVEGNRRISDAAFFRLTSLRSKQDYDEAAIRRQFRALWASGVFDDLWVETIDAPGGKVVVFHVVERPVVLKVSFSKSAVVSQSAIDDRLRERSLSVSLNQPLDRAQIRSVEEAVKRLHEEKGFLGTTVKAQITPVGENGQSVLFVIHPGAKTLMKKIDFEGNEMFSDRALRNLMPHTIETGFKGAFSKKDLYHPDRFAQELESIRSAYQARGHIDLQIKAPIVEFIDKKKKKEKKALPPYVPLPVPPDESSKHAAKRRQKEAKRRAAYDKKAAKHLPPKRRAVITVPLVEGPQYRVGKISVSGNTIYPESVLRPLVPLRTGAVFNADALKRGLDSIEALYGQRGYFYVASSRQIARQPGFVADVTVAVDEGEQYRLHRVEFVGNTTTKDRVLRRELPVAEGDVFNTRLWQIGLTKINQLGYWALAREPVITPVPGKSELDARIEGTEQGRNEVQVGGGFSGVEGAFFQGSYSTRNFLGRGEILTASIQAGGLSQLVNLSFTEPFFLGSNNTVGGSIFRRELDFGDFSRDSSGFSLLFGQRIGNFTTYSVTYRNVRFDEFGGNIFFVTPGDPTFGLENLDLAALVAGETGTPIPNGVKTTNSTLVPVFLHNTINNPFRPNKGFRLRASTQLTGSFLGGDNEFIKPQVSATWYLPAFKKTFFALHSEVGFIEGISGHRVPRSERFFLGGDTRGPRVFQTRSLAPFGPVAGVEPVVDNEGNVIGIPLAQVGGDSFFLAQTEYVARLSQAMDVALFLDAGNSFLDEAGGFDLGDLRYSAGLELRFFLPIFQAPMRLIFGRVLDEQPFDAVNSFQFSIGFPF